VRRSPAGRAARSCAEHEVDGAHHADRGPEEVELQRLVHVQQCERNENRQRDDLLHDLELPEREHRVADPVGRDLQQVFEQRDAPARQRGDPPRPALHVAQMRIPGEGHEQVRRGQQQCGDERRMLQQIGGHEGPRLTAKRRHYRRCAMPPNALDTSAAS
jgi:hypothetical protein